MVHTAPRTQPASPARCSTELMRGIRQDKFAGFVLSVLCVLCGGAQLHAQIDPRQMAGIPRPVDDLPNGSVSVRVIRGALTNNIPNQTVLLQVGSDLQTA